MLVGAQHEEYFPILVPAQYRLSTSACLSFITSATSSAVPSSMTSVISSSASSCSVTFATPSTVPSFAIFSFIPPSVTSVTFQSLSSTSFVEYGVLFAHTILMINRSANTAAQNEMHRGRHGATNAELRVELEIQKPDF
ncbi:hypothetical protein FRB94_013767 [Tulasnella sp. JGI-2019a]|nr:hypothetical protein FRB94_013767 [Tulasnella sp. JGI-2019a]KAG9027132.1 hypothetical protein FRB95_008101 [Tulasnella sp. JGI-2019a]